MDLTPQEIFWIREEHWEPEIRVKAQGFYNLYNRAAPPWDALSEAEQFPWCLAAERQLTANRIGEDRYRAWEKVRELKGYNDAGDSQ